MTARERGGRRSRRYVCLAAAFVAACASPGASARYAGLFSPGVSQRGAAADAYSGFLVARYASLSSDPETAARGYADAAAETPSDPVILERAVSSALMFGDVAGALDLASHAPRDALEEVSLAQLALGVEALRSENSRDAVRRLTSDEIRGFNAIVARAAASWAVLDADGLEAAEALVALGAGRDPLVESIRFANLGLLRLAAGEDEAAFDALDVLWSDGVRLAVATEAYARLLAARGDRDGAISVLRTFREQAGHHAAVDALRRDLEDGLEVDIFRPTMRQGAALAVYAPAAALAAETGGDVAGLYFALALELDPQLDAARTLWADALDRSGRLADAVRQLDAVEPGSSFYATARGQLAWALLRAGQAEAALETARAALAESQDRDLKIQLADLHRALGRDVEAERVLTEIIAADVAEDRADWRLHFARGAARERLGRWRAAEADLRHAAALNPEHPDLLNYLGYALAERGERLDEALALTEKAAALRPNQGYILDSLGWTHFKRGDYDLAVDHLERAAELAPANPLINEHLGDAYWRVGRRQEAAFQWSRVLSLEADPLLMARAEQKLRIGLPTTSETARAASLGVVIQP